MTFACRLKELRCLAGITRRDLAARVQLSETYLEKVERGYNAPPSALAICDIAKALKADKDELLALSGRIAPDLEQQLRSNPLLILACRVAASMSADELKDMLLSHGVAPEKLDWGGVAASVNDERRVRRDAVGADLKRAILHMDNHECVYCSSTKLLEVDHVQPVSLGGTNDVENLVACCEKCNKKKGNRGTPFVMPFGRFRDCIESA